MFKPANRSFIINLLPSLAFFAEPGIFFFIILNEKQGGIPPSF